MESQTHSSHLCVSATVRRAGLRRLFVLALACCDKWSCLTLMILTFINIYGFIPLKCKQMKAFIRSLKEDLHSGATAASLSRFYKSLAYFSFAAQHYAERQTKTDWLKRAVRIFTLLFNVTLCWWRVGEAEQNTKLLTIIFLFVFFAIIVNAIISEQVESLSTYYLLRQQCAT